MTAVLSGAELVARPHRRTSQLRVAMIGCGAIAEAYYLPALKQHAGTLRQIVLVDPDLRRAVALASTLSGVDARCAESHDQVWNDIDAAIIATPPGVHAKIAIPLLARGVHVLCEKPLADSVADAIAMIERAAQSRVCLFVNQTRRSYPALKRVKELLKSGVIGECVTIEHREGYRFAWPSVSGWHFARGNSARGVLLDQGVHALDTICWWLGGKPRVVSCRTDSFGGPEGTADVALRFGTCAVSLSLSWLSQLSNTYRIVGTRGVIEGSIADFCRFTLADGRGRIQRVVAGPARCDYHDLFHLFLANFFDAVDGCAAPLVPGSSVLPAIQLMDECYRSASRMAMPWLETLPELDGPVS
jgi:predicted dehydrogenase